MFLQVDLSRLTLRDMETWALAFLHVPLQQVHSLAASSICCVACLLVCLLVCVCARACLCVDVRAWVRGCARGCMGACVGGCACECVWAFKRTWGWGWG